MIDVGQLSQIHIRNKHNQSQSQLKIVCQQLFTPTLQQMLIICLQSLQSGRPGLLSKFTNSGHNQVNGISETCHSGGVNQLMEHINRKPLFLKQQQHHDVVTEAEIERP